MNVSDSRLGSPSAANKINTEATRVDGQVDFGLGGGWDWRVGLVVAMMGLTVGLSWGRRRGSDDVGVVVME